MKERILTAQKALFTGVAALGKEHEKSRSTQGVGGRGKLGLGLMGLGQTGHEAELASIRQYGYENYAAQAEIDMMMLKEAERSS